MRLDKLRRDQNLVEHIRLGRVEELHEYCIAAIALCFSQVPTAVSVSKPAAAQLSLSAGAGSHVAATDFVKWKDL